MFDNPGWLIGSLIFSTLGLWFVREGRRTVNYQTVIVGAVLILYSYLIDSTVLVWIIGFGLSIYGFVTRE